MQPVCVFEGFMDFLSFLSMKEEVTSACLGAELRKQRCKGYPLS